MFNFLKNISAKVFALNKKQKVILESDIFFGFWKSVYEKCKEEKRPMMVLAPMADVTDVAFRYMLNTYGKPDVTWTEFVSCDGLMSPGREVLQRDLEYSEIERPVVAQLFTSSPENMKGGARLCLDLGFDGVDINMGCPVNVIGKQGAGAKLITQPELAQDIIRAAQEGAAMRDENGNIVKQIPVSVKTRIGFNKIEYKTWLPKILECHVPTLTVHLRTKKEMSAVPAHFEIIDEICDLVKKISPSTILIINGDIKNVSQANEMYNKYTFDGAMIGRGVFGTPWAFRDLAPSAFQAPPLKGRLEPELPLGGRRANFTLQEKLEIMLEHTKLFEQKLGDIKPFALMKKHYKAYVNGFDGASDLRVKLFETQNYDEVEKVLQKFLLEEKSKNI